MQWKDIACMHGTESRVLTFKSPTYKIFHWGSHLSYPNVLSNIRFLVSMAIGTSQILLGYENMWFFEYKIKVYIYLTRVRFLKSTPKSILILFIMFRRCINVLKMYAMPLFILISLFNECYFHFSFFLIIFDWGRFFSVIEDFPANNVNEMCFTQDPVVFIPQCIARWLIPWCFALELGHLGFVSQHMANKTTFLAFLECKRLTKTNNFAVCFFFFFAVCFFFLQYVFLLHVKYWL